MGARPLQKLLSGTSSFERVELMRRIRAQPYDNSLRLEYASLLRREAFTAYGKGQADTDRAEFIEGQCELAELCSPAIRKIPAEKMDYLKAAINEKPRILQLIQRQEALLQLHMAEWANADLGGDYIRKLTGLGVVRGVWELSKSLLRKQPMRWMKSDIGEYTFLDYVGNADDTMQIAFDRGFVDSVKCDYEHFFDHGYKWLASAPLSELRIYNAPEGGCENLLGSIKENALNGNLDYVLVSTRSDGVFDGVDRGKEENTSGESASWESQRYSNSKNPKNFWESELIKRVDERIWGFSSSCVASANDNEHDTLADAQPSVKSLYTHPRIGPRRADGSRGQENVQTER